MKKFLGFLLKILLLAILIVFLYGARNIYIYNELNGEVSKYVKKNIVHTTTTIEAGGEYQIFDVYQRGEKQVVVTKIITVNNEDGIDVSPKSFRCLRQIWKYKNKIQDSSQNTKSRKGQGKFSQIRRKYFRKR